MTKWIKNGECIFIVSKIITHPVNPRIFFSCKYGNHMQVGCDINVISILPAHDKRA